MRALSLGLLLILCAPAARADEFDDSYAAVLEEGRNAYMGQRGINAGMMPHIRVLEGFRGGDGERNQKSRNLLQALVDIETLLAQTRENPLSVVEKRRMTNAIRAALNLDEQRHRQAIALYRPGAPNVLPEISYRAERAQQLALAGGRVDGAAQTPEWQRLDQARVQDVEAIIAAARAQGRQFSEEELARIRAMPAAQARRLRPDGVVPALDAARLAAERRMAGDDRNTREEFEREWAADGHTADTIRRNAEGLLDPHRSGVVLNPPEWIGANVISGLAGLVDNYQKAFGWLGWSRGSTVLSPTERERALDAAALEFGGAAANLIPAGALLTRLGGAALPAVRTLSAAQRLRVSALEAKIARREALTLAEADELVTMTGARPDIVFHSARFEDIEKIVQSGRLAANTERYVYGTRTKIKSVFDQLAAGTFPKDANIVIQGGPAELFRPHDIHGLYSGMKRLVGQQTTSGAGDIVIQHAVWRPETKTLVILKARMPQAGERLFYLQTPAQAGLRYAGRIAVFDAGFTTGAAFGLATDEQRQLVLEYVFGSTPGH